MLIFPSWLRFAWDINPTILRCYTLMLNQHNSVARRKATKVMQIFPLGFAYLGHQSYHPAVLQTYAESA